MAKNKSGIYEVEGRKYTQKKLVLGQIAQLMELLKETTIPSLLLLSRDNDNPGLSINADGISRLLGEKLPRAVAIAIAEEGVPLADKDLDQLESHVRWNFDPETTMKVVEDFFTCNPIVSLLEMYVGMMKKMKESIVKTGSKKSVSCSPGETSRSAAGSSGDTPPQSADRT
jgi:hypothetical protein